MKNKNLKRFVFVIIIFFTFVSAVNLEAQERIVNNYSLRSLLTYPYRTSVITIQRLAFKNALQYAYDVTFTSMGLTVSGVIPVEVKAEKNLKAKSLKVFIEFFKPPVAIVSSPEDLKKKDSSSGVIWDIPLYLIGKMKEILKQNEK